MRYSTKNWSLLDGQRTVFNKIVQFITPCTCAICDRIVADSAGCCACCWKKLSFISKPICPVLGSPFSVDMGSEFLCADAIANPPPFERLRAAVLYNATARRIVSQLKYSDRLDLVPLIARWMEQAGFELLADADVILPVPLHKGRLRVRRFNQSCELSRFLSTSSGVVFKPQILRRIKATQQQVGLSERERRRNVSGAFVVPLDQEIEVSGRRILLVDDVYTTGATTKAASSALKRAGAAAVDVLVFAKVETDADLAI